MTHTTIAPERLEDCLTVTTAALGVPRDAIEGVHRQVGGLFNYVLRVETGRGEYFFKQYLDDVPNPLFNVPTIPASLRAELACEVQRLAADAVASVAASAVPPILHFDRERAASLMARASGDHALNDALSRGEAPPAFFEQLPVVLASLHESTFGRFAPDSVYGNTTFRDFKLRIQYDDMAARLDPAEAAIVMACKESYQRDASCVLHGDLNSRNILVGAGALSVIDFEQSHLGAPAYDLAYILCELFISLENFGGPGASHAPIREFLDRYFARFGAATRHAVETQMTKHFAVQALYRFWGPSRASWTFYVDEPNRERPMRRARSILLRDGPLSEVLA